MEVGSLVKFKHRDSIGLVIWRDPNVHNSVTYKVTVAWTYPEQEEQPQYSYELKVIDESR